MKTFFLCTFLLVFYTSIAQNGNWIISPTTLNEEPITSSTKKGMLLRGAFVKKINSPTNGWQKIEVYKGLEGFVPTNSLAESLNAADKYNISPAPIIEDDDKYGSPHLFVLIASLKARKEPNATSKISKIYTTGEAIPIYYYPNNEDDWAVTSTYSNVEFVQKKYIGAFPLLNNYLKIYDAINKEDITNRKMWAERSVELAWNTADSLALPVLERYLTVAKDLNNQQLINETELAILIAKAQQNKWNAKKVKTLLASKKTYGVIKETKISLNNIALTTLTKLLGKPITKTINECSGDNEYTYKQATFQVNETKHYAFLYQLNFLNGDAFYLDGYKIDKTITEKEFVLKFGGAMYANGLNPHIYSIFNSDEDASMSFVFKNGRIEQFTWQFNDC